MSIEKLLTFISSESRVCPFANRWNELWNILPNAKANKLPLPLILGAWWDSSDSDKRERLALHIRYASEHGVLEEVAQFLLALSPSEWLYEEALTLRLESALHHARG